MGEGRSLPVRQGRPRHRLGTDRRHPACRQDAHVLGWFELAASTIPIGDAIIVLRSNGPKATAYGVHGATAVVLLATAALLFT